MESQARVDHDMSSEYQQALLVLGLLVRQPNQLLGCGRQQVVGGNQIASRKAKDFNVLSPVVIIPWTCPAVKSYRLMVWVYVGELSFLHLRA